MGYVAVKGGGAAIEQSLKLLELQRVGSRAAADVDQILGTFPDLVDQVMGEASLYAPRLAALALKQAAGSPDEAVFLLRAFRSTLERPYVSRTVDTGAMRPRRRISAAFKDVPGGQLLGATRDYSHRLLDFELEHETAADRAEKLAELTALAEEPVDCQAGRAASSFDEPAAEKPADGEPAEQQTGHPVAKPIEDPALFSLPRVLDYLRAEGLVQPAPANDEQPVDATMVPLTIPAPRSVRLQTLARGMTQAVEALGYAAIRGFGPAHPTVGELRAGTVEVLVDHPLEQGAAEDAYYLGSIPVTEVESVFYDEQGTAGSDSISFEIGYGLVFGNAETKAIAMSVLDHCLESDDPRYPTQDQEFVLYHVDGVEATGFISHLKLPHYVTFQSKLSSVRSTQKEAASAPAV